MHSHMFPQPLAVGVVSSKRPEKQQEIQVKESTKKQHIYIYIFIYLCISLGEMDFQQLEPVVGS